MVTRAVFVVVQRQIGNAQSVELHQKALTLHTGVCVDTVQRCKHNVAHAEKRKRSVRVFQKGNKEDMWIY